MSTELLTALAIASAAGLMRGFAGVGSGMLMAPFFVHLFGPVQTVGIIILIEAAVTVQLLPSVHRDIRWPTILPIGAAAMVVMPVGSWLLVSLDVAALQVGVAMVVTVSAALLLTGWRYDGPRPLWAGLGVGGLSGVLMAVTSLGNPPVMLYLLSSRDDAKTNRANFTGYFALTLAALIVVMTARGLIGQEVLVTAAVLLPVFMLAVWIGAKLFSKANEQLYRRVALLILLAAGLYALVRAL
ncbi:MAG: sulfite exporter TauE/SafE family protein [Pseudomonadota bacterium]